MFIAISQQSDKPLPDTDLPTICMYFYLMLGLWIYCRCIDHILCFKGAICKMLRWRFPGHQIFDELEMRFHNQLSCTVHLLSYHHSGGIDINHIWTGSVLFSDWSDETPEHCVWWLSELNTLQLKKTSSVVCMCCKHTNDKKTRELQIIVTQPNRQIYCRHLKRNTTFVCFF